MKKLFIVSILMGAIFGAFVLRGGPDVATAGEAAPPPAPPTATEESLPAAGTAKTYERPSKDELKRKLNGIQFRVTQENGTEPPFQNDYWNNHEEGIYVDVTTGAPLFSSRDKFDSGTGWPSFTKPIEQAGVVVHSDKTHGMTRDEVRSKIGDAHLGHVFDDGPAPGGKRYCINSASLRFIPTKSLSAEGYDQFVAAVKGTPAALPVSKDNVCAPNMDLLVDKKALGCSADMDVAILAGGCFWGMEEMLGKIPGVIDAKVGYTGGKTENPTYEIVCSGKTGHAEAIKIVFDPKKLSYADLLEKWFFKIHDPTTVNQQANDVGTQYRSAIFFASPEQKKVAEEVKLRIDASKKWKRPLVTEITPASKFYDAEKYHQKYLERNPNGYRCHFFRE